MKKKLKRSFASTKLVNDIKNQIMFGKLLPGDPLVSERELCSLYGISLVSVRKALSILEKQGFIEKKWGAGNFVRGENKNFHYIGVIFPNLTNSMFGEFLREITFQASERNCHVIVADTDNSVKREEMFINNFAERGIKYILKFPNVLEEEERLRKKIIESGMKLVVINDFWTDLPGKQVKVDEAEGVKLIMEHLMSLGHRNIAFIDVKDEIRKKAYETYSAIMKKAGCFNEKFVYFGKFGTCLVEGTNFLLSMKKEITACFVPYDIFAIYFLETLSKKHGYKIPEDLAIAGFDDISESSNPNISLTTVRQPKEEIVKKSLELLFDSTDDSSSVSIQIKPELVIRKSTDKKYSEEELSVVEKLERRWSI